MQATFVELPPFQRVRSRYLSDDDYRALQLALLATEVRQREIHRGNEP